jgi:ribonuclease HII
VGAASVADIDRLNIYHATHLAMRRAIARLGGHDHVLVDGLRIADFETEVGPYTAIVDGDARVYSIACASVIAKTVRDRMMRRLALRYPAYGWDRNAGYATREHRAAIRAHGLTPHHRRSFQALQVLLAGDQLGLFDDGDTAEAADDALIAVQGSDLTPAGTEHNTWDRAAQDAATVSSKGFVDG